MKNLIVKKAVGKVLELFGCVGKGFTFQTVPTENRIYSLENECCRTVGTDMLI